MGKSSKASRFAIEAVDRTIQDSLGNNEPFGGKVVLFAGDFRQIIPVVLGGYRSQTVWKCIKMSPLWDKITPLQLSTNKQQQLHPSFQDFLLSNGKCGT
jgi:PIF1-like helicase